MKYRIYYRTWSFDVIVGMQRKEDEFEAPNDREAKKVLSKFSFKLQEDVGQAAIQGFFIREMVCVEPNGDRIVIFLDTASPWTP